MDVVKNHDLLAKKLDYTRQSLIHMRQIHSDQIILVNETLNFDTPPECDALITNRPHTPLMVMSADCTGILIYDPVEKAIGVVHAGRAGALNSILPKTIKTMEKAFGCMPNNLRILFGPSIGGCCYEINEMISAECENKGYSNALRREDKKLFLDVNTILLQQTKEMNIPLEHIEVMRECTSCKSDEYFSYRADNQHTGRIAGLIILR